MEIRPLTEIERKYTYAVSEQIREKTGSIGHLRGDFAKSGEAFFTTWEDHNKDLKTEWFKADLNDVINSLRSDAYGLLQDRAAMGTYVAKYPESGFKGNYCTEYGFRAETDNYAFLLRCNLTQGDYNFYCFCYEKECLDRYIRETDRRIRFIDSKYHELFHIADGDSIVVTYADGEKSEYVCQYLDDYHTKIGNSLYHICQFAELMEKCGATYAPAGQEVRRAEERENEPDKMNEQEKIKERDERAGQLELRTKGGTTKQVDFLVSAYSNNKNLYVGLTTMEEGYPQPYADITVNLISNIPPYTAFVDTNNMPELEEFLVENGIATFSGFVQESGYCTYPLYFFKEEKLRELCPDGMLEYEQLNGLDRGPEKKEKSR